MKKKLGALFGLLCAVFVICSMFTFTVAAASDACSLTIVYTDAESGALEGCAFRLYSIATGSMTGYELADAFAVKRSAIDEADWYSGEALANLSDDLSQYIMGNDIAPQKTELSDQDGRLTFAGLERGLYLAIGDEYTRNGFIYTPQAILIWLPCSGPDGGIDYDPVCDPKYSKTPKHETVDITVEKVWVDDGDHPSSVTVQLLCDGNIYEEVTLGVYTQWSYIWNALAGDHDWQVRERDVPAGYSAHVKKNRDADTIQFTVTNIRNTDPPKTGDNSRPDLLMALMLLSAVGLVTMAIFYHREKKKYKSNDDLNTEC